MKCGLDDGNVYDAVIVGIDPTGDVALIKLLGRDDFQPCVPGNSDDVRVGDEVMALGNPFLLASDFTPTVTYGIVSGVHRYQYPAGTFLEYTDCIQIDASINPGNSGGPLFDIDGRWIGINGRASFEKRGRINSGAAYAISVRQVQLFIDHLKSGRIVDHGRADFTVSTYDQAVEVQQVSELSEAYRRGLRPGDEIISFGGRALTSANDFKNIMGIYPDGVRVPLVFRNDDGIHRVSYRLLPLHGFDEAPQLPEERRPDRPQEPDGDQPDDEDHADTPATAGPPAEYAHLFEAKRGFTNYRFNRVATDRFLGRLKKVYQSSSASAGEKWICQIAAQSKDGDHVGTLTVAETVAGLDVAGLDPQIQRVESLSLENESPQLHGLLFGCLHWYRFFHQPADQFADVVYIGRETLLPENRSVHTLVVREGTTTARWYFTEDEALPVGVDVSIDVAGDEGRLRFDDWKTSASTPMPGRIGVVDADSEQIRWCLVDSVEIRSADDVRNSGGQE